MDAKQRNRADAMASLREDVVAMIATMSGEFDARIKELRALKRELDASETARLTMEQAKELMDKAHVYDSSVKATAEEYHQKFEKMSEGLEARERALSAALADLGRREGALVSALEQATMDAQRFEARSASASQALEERAIRLAKGEAELAAARVEVDSLKHDLNKRLDSLRAA